MLKAQAMVQQGSMRRQGNMRAQSLVPLSQQESKRATANTTIEMVNVSNLQSTESILGGGGNSTDDTQRGGVVLCSSIVLTSPDAKLGVKISSPVGEGVSSNPAGVTGFDDFDNLDDLDGKENETVLQLCNTGGDEDGVRRPTQGEGRDYHNTYTMHGGLSSDVYEETNIESPTDCPTVNVRTPRDTFGTYQDVEAGEYVDVWIPETRLDTGTREHAPEEEVVPGVMPRPGAIPGGLPVSATGGAQVTAPKEKAKAMEKQEEGKQEEEKKDEEKKDEEDGLAMSVQWHDKADTIEVSHAPWNTPTAAIMATSGTNKATGGAVIGVEPAEASDIEESEETSIVGESDVSEDNL